MAKHTDKREEKYEVRHLRAVWSRVDSRIELPPTLSGSALLPRLNGIEPAALPASRKIRFSPRIFTWQSGVTYAAAFVLIVALSTLLSRGNRAPDILQGQISITPSAEATALPEAEEDIAFDGAALQDAPAARADAGGGAAADVDAFAAAHPDEGENGSEPPAVGGQSRSVVLGRDEAFTYTFRKNDPTDPDKEGFPVTVNIMDNMTGELACTVDVPKAETLTEYYVNGGVLALVGETEDAAALFAYDISDMAVPGELLEWTQRGALVDANMYGNIVHILTLADSPAGLDCEIVPLPGAVSQDGYCVVTAVDLETQNVRSKAFSGANGDITLYNLHAYISYDGEPTAENAAGHYVAQIRLDGVEIELANTPEEEGEPGPEAQ